MKTEIKTPDAPQPIGPFSQAVAAGNMIFVSAQFARDAITNEFQMENIKAETKKVMSNIKAILQKAGTDFTDVVKSSIFLKNMGDYAKVNEVYNSYFTAPYPARETIQVGDLPMHVNIEISVIAIKD
jgi:2-iminobutanoate/2-iminopropanoate deaminase